VKSPKVLVTGAGSLLGQGIIRALHASSLRPTIVAVDPSPLAAGLYWVPRRYLVPAVTDGAYLHRVEQILSWERPDAVLVGTDVELPVFAAARERLEREWRTHVVVSSPEVVAVADDKWKTYEFLRAHRFDYPDSCLPGEERALVNRVGFPLVVKPRVGARSKGVRLVRDWAELDQALASGPDLIVQECVGSDETEYTAGALCLDGAYAGSIVMRRELRDGNTYRAFVDEYLELNRAVRDWTEALKPLGPVNFQFRLDRGCPKVFEINARFSGTTPLRASAGFNEVEMVLQHALGGRPTPPAVVKRLTILRHWSETLVEQAAVLRPDDWLHRGASRGARGKADLVLLRAHGPDAERWRDVLRRFPRRDVYYTPEYARAAESPGEEAAAAVMEWGGDAVVHPVMIRDLSAVRSAERAPGARCDVITPYGYGGPLTSTDDPVQRAALVREFDRGFRLLCRRRGAVSEFVRFHPLLATYRDMGGALELHRRGETVWLEISTDEDRVMAAMRPTSRNRVRRARRDGVVVRAESGPEAIRTFTRLYHQTLDRLGAPASYYFPERHFERLGGLLGSACEILVASRDGTPLWTGLFLREGELLHYHLSGSSGDDRVPGVNNLGLLVAAVRGAALGARVFHLGGGVGARADSLFTFKASVGDRRAEFWTGQRIFDPVAYARLCEGCGASAATNGGYFPSYRDPQIRDRTCAS
jgi:carbamoyl-phosphate synthase large subunit